MATDADAESCLMQSAHFSPSSAFATITCLVGIVPRVYLLSLGSPSAKPESLDIVQSKFLQRER